MKRFSGYRARRAQLCSDSEKVQPPGSMHRVISVETPERKESQSLEKSSSPFAILHRASYEDSRTPPPASRVLRIPGRRSVDHPGYGGVVGLPPPVPTSNTCKDTRGIASSFLTYLSRAKRPGSSHPSPRLSSSRPESSRASNARSSEIDDHSWCCSPSRPLKKISKNRFVVDEIGRCIEGRREEDQSLVVVGFDANGRVSLSSAILWVLHNVVKKGDKLTLVGVLEWVRGPLGYKCQVQDHSFLGANQNFLQAEIKLKKDAWSKIPGLAITCEQVGVKLVVDVKAAHRSEVTIVEEALALDATHVVLDKSLKNRRRRYYLENLSCNVTRMRRSGGVDTIRFLENMRNEFAGYIKSFATTPPSPTSVLPSSTGKYAISQTSETATMSSSNRSHDTIIDYPPYEPPYELSCELFSIGHYGGSTRSNSNLLDSDLIRALEQRRGSVSGYESDDLFSIGGDASARASIAFSGPIDLQSIRSSMISNDFGIMNTHSRPPSVNADHRRLDKHLLK